MAEVVMQGRRGGGGGGGGFVGEGVGVTALCC